MNFHKVLDENEKHKKSTWQKIADNDVRHIWKHIRDNDCISIGIVSVHPDWYEENGTPVCVICGQDLEYSHTEIRYSLNQEEKYE